MRNRRAVVHGGGMSVKCGERRRLGDDVVEMWGAIVRLQGLTKKSLQRRERRK